MAGPKTSPHSLTTSARTLCRQLSIRTAHVTKLAVAYGDKVVPDTLEFPHVFR